MKIQEFYRYKSYQHLLVLIRYVPKNHYTSYLTEALKLRLHPLGRITVRYNSPEIPYLAMLAPTGATFEVTE